MTLSYRSGVSVALILLYVPVLIVAIFLTVRHGLKRSSGWRFLVMFALARLLAASFQLATINDPTNKSLYIGEWVLLGIALSPLELAALGLLSRILESINKSRPTLITPKHMRLVQLMNSVGAALGIIGGVRAGHNSHDGVVVAPTISKVGVALFIASFVCIVVGSVLTWPSVSYAEKGEKRLLVAIGVATPFFLVRIIYTAMSCFDSKTEFNPVMGDMDLLLGMALIMELVIVCIFEGVGLTLKKLPKVEKVPQEEPELA